MKGKYVFFYLIILTGLSFFSSCTKYATRNDISGAAYIRIFNSINSSSSATVINRLGYPFFTVIIDPEYTSDSIPKGGAVVADYLGPRQYYNPSTPVSEGNSLGSTSDTTIHYYINYEYPGNTHVLTASAINGFDLSAWAQISSGKHRVLFIQRPQNYTGFANLNDAVKKQVVIDTTIDLSSGKVYTMESLVNDAGSDFIYLRQEDFTNHSFSSGKNYISFYNLSPHIAGQDTFSVYCSYYTVNPAILAATYTSATTLYPSTVMSAYRNIYLTTVNNRLPSANASYYELPELDTSYFYYQGQVCSYTNSTNYYYSSALYNYVGGGTMPFVSFNIIYSGGSRLGNTGISGSLLICDYDPVYINTDATVYRPTGVSWRNVNLFMRTTYDNKVYFYPAVYVLELINGKMYLMQIQKML